MYSGQINHKRTRATILIALSVIVIIVGIVLYLYNTSSNSHPKVPRPDSSTSYSPVFPAKDTSPDLGFMPPSSQISRPVFHNFSELGKLGLSLGQIQIIENSLQDGLVNMRHYDNLISVALEQRILSSADTTTSLDGTQNISLFIQANYLSSEVFKLNISYMPNNSGHLTIVVSKDGIAPFVYMNKLSSYAGQNFSIQQKDTHSTELIISGSDREAALRHITSLGYQIPAMSITFSDYRSPF